MLVRELGVMPGHSWRAVGLFIDTIPKTEADRAEEKRAETN